MTSKLINSNYRIMKILRLLNEKPRSFDELCFELDMENQGVEKITITKYFSILREFGCKIEKKFHKFFLLQTPFQTILNDDEIKILANFCNYANMFYQENKSENMLNAMEKMLNGDNFFELKKALKYEDIESNSKIYLKYGSKIRSICKFTDEEQTKAKIYYRGRYYTITPKKLKFIKNKVQLYAFDEKNLVYRLFLLDDIEEILNLNQISTRENFPKTTIFELKGRVANGYTNLYAGETVLKREKDLVVIENKNDDKEILFHRLLKYCQFCKILAPIEDIENFENLKNNLIEKYKNM